MFTNFKTTDYDCSTSSQSNSGQMTEVWDWLLLLHSEIPGFSGLPDYITLSQ